MIDLMGKLRIEDYLVFVIYFVIVAGYGWWVYTRKKAAKTSVNDFFLAEGSLTWWAIGASLIASNISAEQFIGMSGSGFKMGLAIASYEWMSALTLLVVAVFFIPVYLKNKIFTMPQFLTQRYNGSVGLIMAVFWLLLYVVVNLTSILFLGALAINSIAGIDLTTCMYVLALFATLITLGGMKVIGYTDVIQVAFLIFGGLATTYLALNLVADHFGESGTLAGFRLMTEQADSHFEMILHADNPNYFDLPGLSVILGGLWIANLNYWGCNQYITQRALGASLETARRGILFAAFLKLLMPIIVVLPGIAAYVLHQQGYFHDELVQDGSVNPDRAYPVLLNLLPVGLKGLSFAALTAAVVASLAGKANSVATIFTLDVYQRVFDRQASDAKLVWIGKISVVVSMLLAVVIAPYLGIDKKGGFQYIQEYTGFVSPGIFAMFILGFFWKKTTSNAALFATVGGFIFSILLKFSPQWIDWGFLEPIGFAKRNDSGVYEIPFLDRMSIVFGLCVIGMLIISYRDRLRGVVANGLEIDRRMFGVDKKFAAGSLLVCGILVALYLVFW